MGDRWAGAWSGPVQDSKYVWLPLSFPSATSLVMNWASSITIDTATGTVTGISTSDVWDPNASYQLISRKSNKLLNVIGGSSANGADLEQRADGGRQVNSGRLPMRVAVMSKSSTVPVAS